MASKPETTKSEITKSEITKPETTKSELMTKIYSQASNDFVLATYKKKEKGTQSHSVIDSAIIIKGGANVAFSSSNKHQRNTRWAITEVDAKQLETLKAHKGFMRRVTRGFITINEEPETLKLDKSAQMTEKQMKSKSKATAKTGPANE